MIHDVAIIGAGIAGASLAAALGEGVRVLILEGEDHPGYHTTGRSNAFWHATYGGPQIAPLTLASREPLDEFLSPRGVMTLAHRDSVADLGRMEADYAGMGIRFAMLDRPALEGVLPGLRPEWTAALMEPEGFDIDVAGYHAHCLKQARQQGGTLVTRARVSGLSRQNGVWTVETSAGQFDAALLVNAAGAWADEVAVLAGARSMGVQPYRRTIIQLELAQPVDPDLPMVIDTHGTFYFKPEGANRVWLSPHDETPSPACDAAPEEMDIAVAIDRFQAVMDWPIRRVERSWAGLRSFAPDRLPLFGPDPDVDGLWWCAGQGGFGIQTAPAAAQLCASLIRKEALPLWLAGVDPQAYAPARLI
jgi:D-arginine dehydrogenase